MPDFGRSPHDEPSLDAVRRSDDFIDALATGRPVAPQDSADAALAALLGNWRDEMRWPPADGLITESQALTALDSGRAERRSGPKREQNWTDRSTPKRNRRNLSVVGAAAAAVLCVGGFGAVVAGAGPGDALYGLRSMLFGAPKQVRDDQVALAARTELQQVQEMISRGDWQQAQEKLVAVSTQVASVGDQQQKQELLTQFNDLSAKVVERNPEATAPPGIIYTVPPEATDLVPVVAPPTTDTTTTTSASDSATTSTSPTSPTSGTSTSPTSGAPSTSGTESTSPATSTPATTATSAAPATTSAAPATTTVAPATTSAAPATSSPVQQNQATTTATSAAPASTPTSASSAAAATSAAPTLTATSAPRSAAATTTPTTASAPTTTAAPATTATTEAAQEAATAAETAAPTTAVPEAPEAVITTSVVAPAG